MRGKDVLKLIDRRIKYLNEEYTNPKREISELKWIRKKIATKMVRR